MIPCDCTETHVPRRIVVTGGRMTAVITEMAAMYEDMCTQMMNREGKSNAAGPPDGGPHR